VIGNYLEVASLVAQATTILAGLHVS
jgi:hypothetical protein